LGFVSGRAFTANQSRPNIVTCDRDAIHRCTIALRLAANYALHLSPAPAALFGAARNFHFSRSVTSSRFPHEANT
jgi:hypothetical protein